MTQKPPLNVAIIGAGTMGHGLALVHALGGCAVRLWDLAPEVLHSAAPRIDAALSTLGDAGAESAESCKEARNRITIADSLDQALDQADLVVEAIVESSDAKRAAFAEIDKRAPLSAILASNTSYLDIFPLVPARRQSRALVAHWYTPPYIVDLVDLAPGPETDPDVVDQIAALYRAFGKTVIPFETLIPGYIANRLQSALHLECLRMIDDGWASAAQIDLAIKQGLAARLALQGHMKKMDFTGLDMVFNGLSNGAYQPPPNDGKFPALQKRIAEGRTGVKAGGGFYDYDADSETHFRNRDLRLLRLKKTLNELNDEDTA